VSERGLRVAVIAGGPSTEASVSRASAAGVARALADAGHDAEVIELSTALPARLSGGGHDVVFPAVHGRLGEDGCLQGLLEVMGVPYVGSGVLASALAMSKPHAKAQFRLVGLPLARDAIVRRGEDTSSWARRIREDLGLCVVVKPGAGGSAIGVEPIAADATDDALATALTRALELDPVVLVEEMKSGKEVTCSVLEDDGGVARALPPTLIVPQAAGWYDFRSKYAPSGSVHQCPPPFAAALVERIQAAAVAAHTVLGCRDLSRVDFVVDDVTGELTLLEVNTLPGMTATSLFPEAAAVSGIAFPKLCDLLVRRAHGRPRGAEPQAPPMPT
jgi:D-alanine-D-alanine ligase